MEFPTLGKQCAEESCKQLDFLPFKCEACGKVYCLEHRAVFDHNCTAAKDAVVPSCPLCGAPVAVAKGEDPNIKVDEHISAGCPQQSKSHTNTCSYPRCKKYEVVPVICKKCFKNFCFSHRFPQDHACEGHSEKGVAAKKDTKKSTSSHSSSGANSNNPTALKVKLMKMKMHAKGDDKIPADKRFYLEVIFPMGSGVEPKMMYFDPRWSVGKVLDLIADAGKIENKNHQLKDEGRLHLFSLKTGTPLPNDKYLDTVGSDSLQSGDAVMLDTLEAHRQNS